MSIFDIFGTSSKVPWDVSLTPEQMAGYLSVTRMWQERRLNFIDETLEILFQHEQLNPDYLLLSHDDLTYLCHLIAIGTNVYIPGSVFSRVEEAYVTHGWPYINQTTGEIIRLAKDDTLAPGTLKFLYKAQEKGLPR